ncbi:hypothetical protein INT45_008505, partial [Circinella minor]
MLSTPTKISDDLNKFYGWACPGKGKPLEWCELSLKKFEENDVEIEITHCGICLSDIYTMDSGWGPTDYPCVTGHEITGIIIRLGNGVDTTRFKLGDRVGVGPQCECCFNCKECKAGKENCCRNACTSTYNMRWSCGDKTYGGYSNSWRGNSHFVFKIPDSMPNEIGSVLMCAGATTYGAMKKHGVTEESKVGVVGIGGLGHIAIQWGKVFGAKVLAISSSESKREDAISLGADNFIVSTDSKAFVKHNSTLSHLILTIYVKDFDWERYLDLLEPEGTVVILAIPDCPFGNIPPSIVERHISLSGSLLTSPQIIQEMLNVASEKNVKPWIKKYPMSKTPEAVQAMRDGKARYRIVLEADK